MRRRRAIYVVLLAAAAGAALVAQNAPAPRRRLQTYAGAAGHRYSPLTQISRRTSHD
jgi:hypothetical protein